MQSFLFYYWLRNGHFEDTNEDALSANEILVVTGHISSGDQHMSIILKQLK